MGCCYSLEERDDKEIMSMLANFQPANHPGALKPGVVQKIKGTIEIIPGETKMLISPFTETPCVAYRAEIQRCSGSDGTSTGDSVRTPYYHTFISAKYVATDFYLRGQTIR